MYCPRCNKKLQAITVGTEPAVELDRCRRGHGLWFDAGEIEAVITAFHDGEEIGPRMLARIARRTGLRQEDL